MSQPGAFAVAATAAAASIPTTVSPDAKSCSPSSTSQPAALLTADPTVSTTPPVLANVNSMSANDTPNFPSPTASRADDSSAEMDFTASPENNHNTPTPESARTTVGTSRKPSSTARPRTELISVGSQLPPDTLTPKLRLYDLLAAIISAAHLSSKTSAEITLQAKPAQSHVFLKTPSPHTAHLLLSLTHLQLNGTKPALAPTLAKALTQGTPSEVFDNLTSLYLPPPLTTSYPAYSGDPNPDLDRPFTLRELEAALASNASRSAPGEDAITYTTLRNLPDHAKEFLLQTFNKA
ncbi:mucin-5AC [Dermacentor silvarum]|uniref:mucin-5AC n=1 Tax=Dermacentor silvarum TaxID=543639 RepID=UPI0018990347|nr:mucin-5AC [Dermacentor silvarum]